MIGKNIKEELTHKEYRTDKTNKMGFTSWLKILEGVKWRVLAATQINDMIEDNIR